MVRMADALALRIRMEGGMEAIELSGLEARRLARRLRRAGGPLGWLLLNRGALADEVRAFAREQARVDEAASRLEKLGAAEGWPGGRAPRCLEDLARARKRLAEAAARACLGLGASPSGALLEDLARIEAQLRGGPAVVDAPLVVEPADPSAPYAPQWQVFRSRRRTGALLTVAGPALIAVLAASASAAAAPAFIGWVIANYLWASRMGQFACPRCRQPFAEKHPLAPSRCDHCGLLRYEGDVPRRLKG